MVKVTFLIDTDDINMTLLLDVNNDAKGYARFVPGSVKIELIHKTIDMATKKTSKCLANAGEDEPIFVLRAKDMSSPQIVLEWIKANFDTCGSGKLRDAFECALAMRFYPDRKPAD